MFGDHGAIFKPATSPKIYSFLANQINDSWNKTGIVRNKPQRRESWPQAQYVSVPVMCLQAKTPQESGDLRLMDVVDTALRRDSEIQRLPNTALFRSKVRSLLLRGPESAPE